MKKIDWADVFLMTLLAAFIAFTVWTHNLIGGESEPQPIDPCEFVVKSDADDFSFSESSPGTYKYELRPTDDGYTEVWRCRK